MLEGFDCLAQPGVDQGSEAEIAEKLDLTNLRGYSTGKIAVAIQHIATILESPLQLEVENSLNSHTLKGVKSKYSKVPVQPCCYTGRDDAHLPKAVSIGEHEPIEDLVVARCRQLIYGTQIAASREAKQYWDCLQSLVGLLWRIRDVR